MFWGSLKQTNKNLGNLWEFKQQSAIISDNQRLSTNINYFWELNLSPQNWGYQPKNIDISTKLDLRYAKLEFNMF
jgi:hypothetical protein